jgi:phosphohistidine swiveling domain-containing protein
MSDNKLAELWKTQKSLTEWLEDIKHKDADAIRREDSQKHIRLNTLNEIINLPFSKPVRFDAIDLANKTQEFVDYLENKAKVLCALRLIPKVDGLPKLRMRGKTTKGAYEWFLEQNIDASKYKADFIPHEQFPTWATIFVVNKHGLHGEIVWGGHYQLTQGFHDNPPMIFNYDFKKWTMHPKNTDALKSLKKLVKNLYVPQKAKQQKLQKELGATFTNNYLEGYFETMDSLDFGGWFIDYSQSLGRMYEDLIISLPGANKLAKIIGLSGSKGTAKGKVKIVHPDKLHDDFEEGSVLVCPVTTPMYVPLMQKAASIVTDQGGILSHAAIVARELGKPCIVGTGNATKELKNGQLVTVNATDGLVITS